MAFVASRDPQVPLTPVMAAVLERWKQEDQKFKVILSLPSKSRPPGILETLFQKQKQLGDGVKCRVGGKIS